MKRHKVTNESLRKQIAFELILKGRFDGIGICNGALKSTCEDEERWGNICCIDCRFLSKCVQKWESSNSESRVCYILKRRGSKEQAKWCSAIHSFFMEKYRR